MFKKATWLIIASSVLIPILLSCTDSSSPYTAASATISIMLENSSKQRSVDAVSDTVDKTVRVGISAYLPKYITSVLLAITKSPGDTDTAMTFTKISDWNDTQWISITFNSAGTRTVSAIAVIPEAKDDSVTAKIIIAGKLTSVTYDGNGNTGGTVPVDAAYYPQGASVTVKANVGSLVRTGYTFAGWNTAVDGKGTSYAGGETFDMGVGNITLFAKWTQNATYSVTYDGNGNIGGTVPTDANAYEQGANVTVKANSGNLTKTSYTFAGWNTAADGKGTSYAGGETFSVGAANVTLYAKWTQNPTYTVTYNGNGNTAGTAPADANAYEQGASVIVKANTGALVKTGFTFAGWNTVADGSGASYAGSETFNIGAANVTLYANWTQNVTYTVTYNGNGSTSGGVPTDANAYEQGASVTVRTNSGNLAKTGYTFAGWNTANDGTGTSYAGGETFNIGAANVALFAKWTQNPTYTVTYTGNGNTGGSAPADANAYEQGASVTVKANTGNLVKTSYTFAGWNTAADGSGTSYSGAATFTMGTANVTLYAKWTQNPTYTVTYNGNGNTGGTAPADANSYEQNATVTVKANTGNLVRTSYTFAGWNTTADGSGTSYTAAATFTMGTANVTLYAKWTQNPTYTVTYNGNGNTGGTAPTDANSYEQNATVTVKANTGNLVRTSYTFAGWNTAADGSGTSYAAAATFTMGTANVTLYAKWTANPYTITFDKNDAAATGTMASQIIASGSSANLTPNGFSKTGWAFIGWATTSTGAVAYADGANYTMGTANVTLYAKWTANAFTITFDKNDAAATGTMVSQNIASGSSANLSPNGFIKTGWTFSGWATTPTGAVAYADGASYTMGTANVTLYAKWTINVYTVTFNSQGGSAVASQNVNYNSTASSPTAPTQAGFIFAGWYSDQTVTVPFIFTTPITSSITLYAKWTPVYTVAYLANGSTSGAMPVDGNNYTNGTVVTVLDNTGSLAKTGYTFSGWNTNSTGTGADRTPGTTFAIGSTNVTLYAKWTIIKYTVTFNSNGGSSVASQSVDYGSLATVPTAPTKTSYVFAGWYSNAGLTTAYNFSTPVTSAITLYAKWEIRDADGNVYAETTINGKVWMVQNLKTTRFNDNTMIPLVTDSGSWFNSSSAAYCWYNNDPSYKNSWGAIYNFYAASSGKLAPTGWHVPTDAEWMALLNFYGGQTQAASDALRETGTAHWSAPNTGATNSSGFSAVPTGTRSNPYNPGGFFPDITIPGQPNAGFWWTSTAVNAGQGWFYDVGETWSEKFYSPNYGGMGVRCVRDY
jgi:uncharacterized protein (TIGR02145 family)/uncharacterized repeat protein (TIGR02543 family)